MSKRLPSETILKIRNEVLSGKSKYQVAKELGICDTVVYHHTKDIARPKNIGPCILSFALNKN